MRNYLTKWVLNRVSKKRAPSQFALANEGPAADAMNWFILKFTASHTERYLFRAIEPAGYKFGQFGSEDDVYLDIDQVAKMEMSCEFYYRGYLVTYRNKRAMFISQLLGTWWLTINADKLSQWLFNRRSLVTADRIEMMRFLCGEAMKDANFRAEPQSRANAMHGKRFWRHPGAHGHVQRERFLLDSLVATGDLSREQDGHYRVQAKMVASLESIEGEDRRHRRSNRIQWALFLVALFAAAATFIQAFEAWQQGHRDTTLKRASQAFHSTLEA